MCDCTSCKYTDSFADKGFAAWPRGEPAGKAHSEAIYRAHVAHSGWPAKPRAAFKAGAKPVYPVSGTPQSDPRIYYHFPGGQVGRCSKEQGPRRFLRDRTAEKHPASTTNTAEYVRRFLAANHLTPDEAVSRRRKAA